MSSPETGKSWSGTTTINWLTAATELISLSLLLLLWSLKIAFPKTSFPLALPIIATALYIGLGFLSKFHKNLNYPVSITPQNAERQYGLAKQLLRGLRMSIATNAITIALFMEHVEGQRTLLIVPILLGLTIIPIINFIARSTK